MFQMASAELTTKEITENEYLRNNGYSAATVEAVQASKARANNEKFVSAEAKKHAEDSKLVKCIRKVFMYFDPVLETDDYLQHDIKLNPHASDL